MLKTFCINTLLIFCIVFAILCFFGCLGYLFVGDLLMVFLCGLGLSITAGGAATIIDVGDKTDF